MHRLIDQLAQTRIQPFNYTPGWTSSLLSLYLVVVRIKLRSSKFDRSFSPSRPLPLLLPMRLNTSTTTTTAKKKEEKKGRRRRRSKSAVEIPKGLDSDGGAHTHTQREKRKRLDPHIKRFPPFAELDLPCPQWPLAGYKM